MPVSLYERLVSITEEYLGPAAERFMMRHISFHLHKNPEQLSLKDIPKLVDWLKVSMALLTNDKSLVDEYERRLLKLR
jgi:hypothetical protein